MSNQKVIAARNLKDWTKFTTLTCVCLSLIKKIRYQPCSGESRHNENGEPQNNENKKIKSSFFITTIFCTSLESCLKVFSVCE
jgi:hypothetical protein